MVETSLNWHEDFIVHLADIVRPRLYVELGLYQCKLFNRIIPYAQHLIGVDIDSRSGCYMQKSEKTHFVNSTTQEFVKNFQLSPLSIELLFIDADHSEAAVVQDFETFFPFVTPHGLILLHDTHPGNEEQLQVGYCGTAYLAIEKLSKQTTEFEMMTIPISPGLTICRKRQAQLAWQESKS